MLGVILWLTYSTRQEITKEKAEIDTLKSWIDTVNRSGWKLEKDGSTGELENSSIAERNRQTAVNALQEMRSELYRRFSIRPTLPRTSSQARDMLDAQLAAITRLALVNYKMDFQGTIGGKLADTNSDSKPIIEQDFLPIFRQLEIYRQVVDTLGRSGVKRVIDLNFPRSLLTEEGDGYTVTPIVVSLSASPAVIQIFLNRLSQDPNYLFIIRNLSFFDEAAESPADEYTQIALLKRQVLLAKQAATLGGGAGRDGGMTGGSASTGRSRSSRNAEPARRTSRGTSGRESSTSRRASGRGDSSRSMSGMEGIQNMANLDESLLTYEEPKRQDNFVFRAPRSIQVEITLDLIEFSAPEGGDE
ncbi:MAG: hypothetical protein ACI4SG_03760 [Oligosphaeraceae bacterium]